MPLSLMSIGSVWKIWTTQTVRWNCRLYRYFCTETLSTSWKIHCSEKYIQKIVGIMRKKSYGGQYKTMQLYNKSTKQKRVHKTGGDNLSAHPDTLWAHAATVVAKNAPEQ